MLTDAELEGPTEAIRHDAIDACGAGRVVPLSEAYLPPGGFYDEMFAASGRIRRHCLGPAERGRRRMPGFGGEVQAETLRNQWVRNRRAVVTGCPKY